MCLLFFFIFVFIQAAQVHGLSESTSVPLSEAINSRLEIAGFKASW